MIIANINVSKIDKSHLFKGKKGVYLSLILKETPDSEYGNDYMVVQGVSKESREAGDYGEILGNAKTFTKGAESRKPKGKAKGKAKEAEESDDVPF
jgi:hypothetical protein